MSLEIESTNPVDERTIVVRLSDGRTVQITLDQILAIPPTVEAEVLPAPNGDEI